MPATPPVDNRDPNGRPLRDPSTRPLTLGFPPELGRGIFILARALGILAHAWEEKQHGTRLKGPMPRDIRYRYSGPPRRAVPARRTK